MATKAINALLFYNPKSGNSKLDQQLEKINHHFSDKKIPLETILVPKPADELKDIIDKAVSNGVNLIMAAGGDGTVSMISTHLVGTGIPLGILPLGTGNVLAKALQIPHQLEQSLELITGNDHKAINIDTFKMDERFFVLNVSVGVSPEIMRAVGSSDKQRMGFFAYLINFIQQLLGVKMHRVTIDCDNKKSTHFASEILITNVATAGIEPLYWSEDIKLTDGNMDLLIFRAQSLTDILGLLVSVFTKKGKSNPVINFLQVTDYCRIDSQTTLQTQADGDIVGQTPFEIKVYPGSLSVIVNEKVEL